MDEDGPKVSVGHHHLQFLELHFLKASPIIPILFWETQMSCQLLLFSFGSLHCCQFHTFGRWQGRATQTWKVRAHHVGSTTTLA